MLAVFTDQAYNLILLADDEARMLGRSQVEPEHLLLALARYGNVESLLRERGISATQIHTAIRRTDGVGPDLMLGEIPRSPATEAVLQRAVDAAARRGVLGPSSEDVLVGLSADERVAAILAELGVEDIAALVDARYPAHRAPLTADQTRSYALRLGTTRSPPRPGPIPPVFERFTLPARQAIAAGERAAAALEHEYVHPFHLLLGLLQTPGSLACNVLRRHGLQIEEATRRAQLHGPRCSHQSTGIFTDDAREVVAKGALKHAHRHGHGDADLDTGHVLLAVLDTSDAVVARILDEPSLREQLAADVVSQLPGDEEG